MARQLFPIIGPQAAESESESLPLYKEVAWNFETGKPIFKNGTPIIVSGKEAVKVWIWKALKTQRTKYPIYTWNFGSEHETLIGQNYIAETKRAEAIRYTKEAVDYNKYIKRISDLDVEFKNGLLTIHAKVETIYGEVRIYV